MRPSSLLEIDGLTVDFATERGIVRAAGDVSFTVGAGEIVALVGESGSGKSATVFSILRMVPPPGRIVGGRILFERRELMGLPAPAMVALRGRRIGWISQTPRASLNPAMRIGEQIAATLAACLPDLPRAERKARALTVLQPLGFADPARVADSYPHELSGGMCQRVAIGLALAGDPALLIADEPTTALDVAVQAEILGLLRRLNRERGLSILIVTHDLAIVRAVADRVVVLYGGEVQEVGTTDAVLGSPRHPYTRALLAAVPPLDSHPRRLPQLPGQPGLALADAPGCRFADRCAEALADCRIRKPNPHRQPDGHRVRCHRAEEVTA